MIGSKFKDADRPRAKIVENPSNVAPVENIVTLHLAALARYGRLLCGMNAAFQAGLGAGDNAGGDRTPCRELIAILLDCGEAMVAEEGADTPVAKGPANPADYAVCRLRTR